MKKVLKCSFGSFLPLQWWLSQSQSRRPLLIPAAIVLRGARLLEWSGVVGQQQASFGCRGLGCTGWSDGILEQKGNC